MQRFNEKRERGIVTKFAITSGINAKAGHYRVKKLKLVLL